MDPVPSCDDSAFLPNGRPYLQLGPSPSPTSLERLWLAPGGHHPDDWQVEIQQPATGDWEPAAGGLKWRRVEFLPRQAATLSGPEPRHTVYAQPMDNLPAGGSFFYRVQYQGRVVFQDQGRALRNPDQPQRIALAGDLVSNNPDATKRIAHRILAQHPDLMVVPGDIVNLEGHAHQYRNALFAHYNASASGPGATWKIVVFHYPIFTHSTWYETRYREREGQRMRQLWPIFQRHSVDLTFSGHLHTYQRTRPIRFLGDAEPCAVTGYPTIADDRMVEDHAFTGAAPTTADPHPPAPAGVISIITGAGGAHLHPGQVRRPAGSRPDPVSFVDDRHSFSLLDIDGNRLTFRQLDEAGSELDRFVIQKR